MLLCTSIGLYLFAVHANAQQNELGTFSGHTDIGSPKISGNAIYNKEDQTYLLSSAGENIWAKTDQFHFLWKKIKGDFMIKATVHFIGKGVAGHRKLGVMARDKLSADSRYIDGAFHGGLPVNTSLQYRNADGDTTGELTISSIHPTEIAFERTGNIFTFSAATFGENYKSVSKEMPLNEEPYVGLFLCSHMDTVTEQAVFSNVRIIIPPAKDFKPYTDFIGSYLEVMDVTTGLRKVLYHAPKSIQAPNWTPDNKYLIYNSAEGFLYKYELSNGSVSKINTGKIRELNNDHVLSFDGKLMGISDNHGSKSSIYILPVTGSDDPVRITADDAAHSYLHGWSPDKRKLIFTGLRNKQWDIYAIDINTKKETQLTDNPTLDDGSEFTPDGKWIYFNSVRTGTMKIWRMKADGTKQEQVTFDEYNDWFPHISPDGKWIAYISFPKEIDPSNHPFYQKVYIRLMPATGGVPKNIAYLYGGQGTMNVPSWSPDSKKIAFVTNTDDK